MTQNKDELTMVVPLVTTFLVVIMLGVIWYKLALSASRRMLRLPPGPSSIPVVVYLPFLRYDLHNKFNTLAHTYGPIFKFYLGSKLHVVINTPELAKEVVHDHDDTFANRDLTIAAAVISHKGQNLIFSENDVRLNLRKIFVHELLSNKNLKACSSIRRDEVRNAIKYVYSKIGTKVNVSDIAYLIEANVITRMAWDNTSYKGELGVGLGAELQSVVSRISKRMVLPNLSDYLPILAWFDLQGTERSMNKEHKKLDHIISRIIEDRIKSNSEINGVRDERKKDFLQSLLDLKDQQDLNITQVKGLITDFMIAGIETMVTVIEWAMANIMKNHKVMKRVQELVEIVGLNNMVEESHLPKLRYLEETLKETHRLNPVGVILIPRVPSKDCEVGGYTIPKGCITLLNVLSIHRSPQYWDDPMEFNPERFLANKWDYTGKDLKFFPFGSGRRSCPGIPLAQKMQLYILASLLHSFEWSLPKGEELDMSETFGLALKKTKPLIAIPCQRLLDSSLYMQRFKNSPYGYH